MEETEYKSTYKKLTAVACVFEKALTNKQAKCSLAKHFCLADREGYSCNDNELSVKCRDVLELLRKKSSFVLKLHEVEGPLPHNMEIRVQAGGIKGLATLVNETVQVQGVSFEQNVVDDISRVVQAALDQYGSWDQLPYSDIIQSVVRFQGRRRRQQR